MILIKVLKIIMGREEKMSKILIVDDSQSVRQSLNYILSRSNFLVEEASNGREALAKASKNRPDIIILDEPTSMLTPAETNSLFKLLISLRESGKSIVIITHHLEEAIRISDRITILRQGKVVETLDTHKSKQEWKSQEEGMRQLASLMVGREVLYQLERPILESGNVIVNVSDLYAKNDMGDEVVKGVSFQLKERSNKESHHN